MTSRRFRLDWSLWSQYSVHKRPMVSALGVVSSARVASCVTSSLPVLIKRLLSDRLPAFRHWPCPLWVGKLSLNVVVDGARGRKVAIRAKEFSRGRGHAEPVRP